MSTLPFRSSQTYSAFVGLGFHDEFALDVTSDRCDFVRDLPVMCSGTSGSTVLAKGASPTPRNTQASGVPVERDGEAWSWMTVND